MRAGFGPPIPRRPGAADALMVAMLAEGVDLDDRAAIGAWMEAFNNRTYEERAEILTDDIMNAGVEPFPPVEMPDEDVARRSAAESTLLRQIRGLVDFVDTGRKLTQKGNLTLADARELVSLLGTDDRFDETIGDRTFKTKSAADLPQLSLIVRLATAARFVKVAKGRMMTTRAGKALGVDPLADLARLVEAIDTVGMVSGRMAQNRFVWGVLAPFFDDLIVPLSMLLLSSPEGAEFDAIVEQAFEDFENEIDLGHPHWNADARRGLVETEMRTAVTTLEAAGAATWDSTTETSDYGTTKRTGGVVAFTPAGRWTFHRHLAESYEVRMPVIGPPQFTAESFEALIAGCETAGPRDFSLVDREITAWLDHRGDAALDELLLAARTAEDPGVRSMALAVIGDRFEAVAEPAVRSLLDVPGARAAARFWLFDTEVEPPEILLDPDPVVFGDVLTFLLASHSPLDMVDVFDHIGGPEAQMALLQELWRLPSPAIGLVLTVIGRHHPNARIAKEARKSAMRHAGRQANLRP